MKSIVEINLKLPTMMPRVGVWIELEVLELSLEALFALCLHALFAPPNDESNRTQSLSKGIFDELNYLRNGFYFEHRA